MSHIDRVSQIAAKLEQAILSGELTPGDQIPSEREISARLKVSRSVVREALGRLASLGMVHSVHGSGTRVAAPTSKQVTLGYERLLRGAIYRLEDVSAVRLPLETSIVAVAARKRSAEHLARLEKSQTILGNPKRSLEAHVKADLEFHITLAEATGNPVFAIVLAPIQELLIESRRRTLRRYGAELAHQHHAKILKAIAAGDADTAVRAMRFHLETNYEHLSREGKSQTTTAKTQTNQKHG